MDVINQQFECSKCHRNLFNQKNLDYHKRYVDVIINQGITCVKNMTNTLSDHLLFFYMFFMYYECNIPFIHPKALNYHIEYFHIRVDVKKKDLQMFTM